jgi:hypothetical protein
LWPSLIQTVCLIQTVTYQYFEWYIMFIYHRNVSVSIVVAIIRKRNNDALTNNIYTFFLKYIHTHTDTQTDTQTHTLSLLFIRKEDS